MSESKKGTLDMTIDNERYRPYGSTRSVISFCERARSRNLPETIGDEFFRLADIEGQAIRRTLHTLVFLGLLDTEGTPSPQLRLLAGAPEGEWRSHLRTAVETAYRSDLEQIDPAKDDPSALRDLFQKYEPRSQTGPMTSLFLGLCRESGMEVKAPPRAKSQRPRTTKAPTQPRTSAKPSLGERAEQADASLQHKPDNFGSGPASTSDLFNVTSEIIGELNDDEFREVWNALGVVARARARVIRSNAPEVATAEEAEVPEEPDE